MGQAGARSQRGGFMFVLLMAVLASTPGPADPPALQRPSGAPKSPSPSPPDGGRRALPEATQLLVLQLQAIDVSPEKVQILNGRIASILAERKDVEPITATDIQTMAQIDADRSVVGCDEASCLAEIASALGTRYVVFGQVGKLDDLFLLQLNLFDASMGRPVSRQEAQAAKLGDLSQKLPDILRRLLEPLAAHGPSDGGPAPSEPTGASTPVSPLLIAGAACGLAGVATVATLTLLALGHDEALTSSQAPVGAKQSALDARPWIIAGLALGGVAALAGSGLVAYGLTE